MACMVEAAAGTPASSQGCPCVLCLCVPHTLRELPHIKSKLALLLGAVNEELQHLPPPLGWVAKGRGDCGLTAERGGGGQVPCREASACACLHASAPPAWPQRREPCWQQHGPYAAQTGVHGAGRTYQAR